MSHEHHVRTFDQWAIDGQCAEMEDEHGDVARQVIAKLGIRAGEQILDLGCGSGWSTRLLAKVAAGVQATGIDVSPRMIAEAERIHSLTIRARYQVGPFERLEFQDGKFHRVFSIESMYYAVDLPAALREVQRVLRPGGSVDVVIDYFKDNPATACWASKVAVPMIYLSEREWRDAFENAGLIDVATARVVDSRGPGDPAKFEPDCCYSSWEVWRDIRSIGSLWVHGAKPK
jgi:SAM-dependent methyltransferase